MINIFSRIKYGIKIKSLSYAIFKYKEPKQVRPYNVSSQVIRNVFKYIPREYWYDTIKPLIWDLNEKDNGVVIIEGEKDPYPFEYIDNNPEYLAFNADDLLINKFYIEPGCFYTHKKYGGVFVAADYIPLDERFESKDADFYRAFYGSLVEGIGISDDGYTYGWEKGHYSLSETNDFYTCFEKISYSPVEGEYLYYIKKIIDGELHEIEEEDYYKSIWGATSDMNLPLGDTSNKEYFESFFKEYK